MRLDDEDSAENGLLLIPGSHGMNVPSACTIVFIAGCILIHTQRLKQELKIKHIPLQVNTSVKWTG